VVTGCRDIDKIGNELPKGFRVHPTAVGDVLDVRDAKLTVEFPTQLGNHFPDRSPPALAYYVTYEKQIHVRPFQNAFRQNSAPVAFGQRVESKNRRFRCREDLTSADSPRYFPPTVRRESWNLSHEG
jgi:hypothetical protein